MNGSTNEDEDGNRDELEFELESSDNPDSDLDTEDEHDPHHELNARTTESRLVSVNSPHRSTTSHRKVKTKRAGEVIPKRFRPQIDIIRVVSTVDRPDAKPPAKRYAVQWDSTQMTGFCDGACADEDEDFARAGYCFRFAPDQLDHSGLFHRLGYVYDRLENKGPTGIRHLPSEARAEVRAAIGLIQYRNWQKEGAKSLVIATHSKRLVKDATKSIKEWLKNDWRMIRWDNTWCDVPDRDLWELLLKEIAKKHNKGLEISFWYRSKPLHEVDYRSEFEEVLAGQGAFLKEIDEFSVVRSELVQSVSDQLQIFPDKYEIP